MIWLSLFALADNRLILFDQSDFGAKKGWYVAFENQGPDGVLLPADSLKLILAVADGKQWRFAAASPMIVGQHHVVAEIGSGRSTLRVDNVEVARIEGDFLPQKSPVVVGRFPEWANAPTTYRLSQAEYHVAVGNRTTDGTIPSARFALFEKPAEHSFEMGTAPKIEVSTTVTIEAAEPIKGPLVDSFGQVIGASNAKPVRSPDDLQASIAEEAKLSGSWIRDPALDLYGGLTNSQWHGKPTGYYRVEKHDGKWTMVSPLGNPLFYTGLCTTPSPLWDVTPTTGRESLFSDLPPKGELWKKGVWGDDADYFSPVGWSLMRKYGPEFATKAQDSMKKRLAQWGFTGMGKWAQPVNGVPRVVDLSADWPKLNRHLDPYDSAACDQARASLRRQLADVKADPWVVGTSIGNEYDEIVTRDEIRAIISGPNSPARAALGSDLSNVGVESARKKYAKAYYEFLYKTVKEIDPNHMYFGFWISVGWWQDESDWDLAAPYCDVLGYDRYSDRYVGMEDREKRTDKPVLLGEFSHPAWYGGTRGYGRYGVFTETDAESGRKYGETVGEAAQDPYCVGALWFQYRDEPVTGRGPGKGLQATQGEHYAFGFVDVNDRPKWDLVRLARSANLIVSTEKIKGKR